MFGDHPFQPCENGHNPVFLLLETGLNVAHGWAELKAASWPSRPRPGGPAADPGAAVHRLKQEEETLC
jgi:hypothetical protein